MMAVQTHYFNWEAVYDDTGTDYLYTKVSGAWRAVINGIASIVGGLPGPWVNYGPGAPPPQTVTLTGGTGALPTAGTRNPAPGFFPSPPPDEGLAGVGSTPGFAPPVERSAAPTLRGIVLNPPAPLPGNDPAITHQTIRHRLTTPRGQLYVFWGRGMEANNPRAGSTTPPVSGPLGQGPLFLESPIASGEGRLACDCKNGPFPKLLNVVECVGDVLTMMVDFAVETYVNEGYMNGVGAKSALLSNRFGQVHEVGEDSYTTITTEGAAIFRTDVVYALPQSPDSVRSVLFMPIPQGFTRKILYVRGRPDVTGVEYGYRDTQVSVNFVAGPYTKAASMSAVHRQAIYNQPDIWSNGPLSVYERYLGIAANKNFAKHANKSPEPEPPKPVKPGAPGASRLKGGGTPAKRVRGRRTPPPPPPTGTP